MILKCIFFIMISLSCADNFAKICKSCESTPNEQKCKALREFTIQGNDNIERPVCEHYGHFNHPEKNTTKEQSVQKKTKKRVHKHRQRKRYKLLDQGKKNRRLRAQKRFKPNTNFN
ncbi:MAG: hypothetical protein CMF41_06855 [Legionellales bacterium]|nr:hypothetical protein [Legionellales bacterium]OUX63764.1 MAG: hypothetical protein CBE41_04510 [Gammaproteobacteria bacterium TMED281]